MKRNIIYLDNSSTTRVLTDVVTMMNKYQLENYGNTSSIHIMGSKAKNALEEARQIIAESISAKPERIIFTSGGTESNNLALKGISNANKAKGNNIIISKIEHASIIKTVEWLANQGFDITYLDVDKYGFVNPLELESKINDSTILVSIIHGNNEIGTIQSLSALYKICKKHNVYFHTDACQSYTKTKLISDYADLISLNAHKIHGPKGVGALYVKKGTFITPLSHGGKHENKFRAGTINLPGIIGFAEAVRLSVNKDQIKYMADLRDYFISKLLKIDNAVLNGPLDGNVLCNIINISFKYLEGEGINSYLNSEKICTSTGSACSSQDMEPSHVVMALDSDIERAKGALRFSLSRFTTKEEIDITVQEVKKIVNELYSISPFIVKTRVKI